MDIKTRIGLFILISIVFYREKTMVFLKNYFLAIILFSALVLYMIIIYKTDIKIQIYKKLNEINENLKK